MEPGWDLVYSTSKEYLAEIALELLDENDIKGISINKHDSAYTLLGEIEIYVPSEDLNKAKEILKNIES